MKIINAGYKLIEEPSITKKIERIARVCYKSEDKIADRTDIKMIQNLLKRQHTAMLEHASIILEVGEQEYMLIETVRSMMENMIEDDGENNKKCYLRYTNECINGDADNLHYVVSGNIRAWYEFMVFANSVCGLPEGLYEIINDQLGQVLCIDLLKFDTMVFDTYEEEEFYAKVITDVTTLSYGERMIHETFSVLFTVDRGVTHELVRMRDCSFAQESTRYCNYSLGKYEHEITFIEPCFWDITPENGTPESIACYNAWYDSCKYAESQYFKILDNKGTAQQARDVLPTSVKADIVMTTNLAEWKHIFNLRACDSTGPAHPQMKEVMIPLFKEIRNKYSFAFGNMVAANEVK